MTEFRLLVPRAFYDEMIAHARAELPNECVGIFSGVVEEGPDCAIAPVQCRYPLINEANSPKRYHAEKSLFDAHRAMYAQGHIVLAIYHSHPTSAPIPSRTDLEQNNWPSVVHLIVSLKSEEPHVRGWWLTNTDYREAEWEIVEK